MPEATEPATPDVADLALETLTGDIRDALLTHIRAMYEPWQKLSETKQQDKIYACTQMSVDLVRRAAQIIAGKGFESVMVSVGKITVTDKGQIKSEIACSSQTANVVHLMERQNRPSLLILVDPDDYSGERAVAKPDPDQPDLVDEAEAA